MLTSFPSSALPECAPGGGCPWTDSGGWLPLPHGNPPRKAASRICGRAWTAKKFPVGNFSAKLFPAEKISTEQFSAGKFPAGNIFGRPRPTAYPRSGFLGEVRGEREPPPAYYAITPIPLATCTPLRRGESQPSCWLSCTVLAAAVMAIATAPTVVATAVLPVLWPSRPQ